MKLRWRARIRPPPGFLRGNRVRWHVFIAPHHYRLSVAAMCCTPWRCRSAQQCVKHCVYCFHVMTQDFHTIWHWIWWIPVTRCQLTAATWAQNHDKNTLVVIQETSSMFTPLQIDRLNLTCWQARGKLPSCIAMGTFNWGMTLPAPLPYITIGDTLNDEIESMQGTASTLPHFSDYQGQAHKMACSKDSQQSDAFETVRFAATSFPLVECLRVIACICPSAICPSEIWTACILEGLALASKTRTGIRVWARTGIRRIFGWRIIDRQPDDIAVQRGGPWAQLTDPGGCINFF